MTIPASAIRLSYLDPFNAAMAAHTLSHCYGERITASQLRDRWEAEVETCLPLRALGERPEKGFDQTKDERVALVRALLKAEAETTMTWNDNTQGPRELFCDCIGCEKPIYVGDRGFFYSDGPVACEMCAPTYAEAKTQWEEQHKDDPEGFAAFGKAYDAHIAAGGKPTDQCVTVL